MTCFTDCYEVATSVLNSDVAAIISEYSDLIEYIYVTDIDMEYEQYVLRGEIMNLCGDLHTPSAAICFK